MDTTPETDLTNDEAILEEFAKIIYEAVHENLTPNWTWTLLEGGFSADNLRDHAKRWRDWDFEPRDFADRVLVLADAIERTVSDGSP